MHESSLWQLGHKILSDLPLMWTFMLLVMRYTGLMMILPGIGGGATGIFIRYPAILMLAFVSMPSGGAAAVLPDNWAIMCLQVLSEIALGYGVGLVPYMLVSGVQMGGYLSSTAMGLGAGHLIDPTLSMPTTDLARIFGDLTIIIFLLMGGQYAVIHALSGSGTALIPGAFVVTDLSFDLLLRGSEEIFSMGVMISAPVIVALLLTQFVLGLISRAVPQVNAFIVAFPLTVGIGLILSIMSVPELYQYLQGQMQHVDQRIGGFVESAQP